MNKTNYIENLSLIITSRCNLNCIYCYYKDIYYNKNIINNLDFEKVKKFININNINIGNVYITGGEPTTHLDFIKFINLLKPISKKIFVFTNGTKTSFKYVDELIDKNVVIQVSIDSLDKSYTNKVRGGYDEIMKFLEYLKSIEYANVVLAITVNSKNINSSVDVIEYSLKNNWKCELSFVELNSTNELALNEKDIGGLERIICSKLQTESLTCEEYISKKIYLVSVIEMLLKNKEINFFRCEVAKNTLCVDLDGSIYCCFHNKNKIGTIDMNLNEILENKEKFLQKIIYSKCVRLGCI